MLVVDEANVRLSEYTTDKSYIPLSVIAEYHHFTPLPWLRREERVTEFTPIPIPPHARRALYMHSAKEGKRQDHRGYQCMSGLSGDD